MKFRVAAGLLAVLLSACDLGEGSRPVSITIIPAGAINTAKQLQMTECFREPLALQVTFSDGQIGNVTNRAIWSSSDDTKVRVSNGDVNLQAIVDGQFDVLEAAFFTRGLLIPKAPIATPVTITANFLGLTTSLDVIVDPLATTAQLVPRPVVSAAFTPPKFIGEGFSERFTVRLLKNGRVLDAGDFGRNDSIFNSAFNPVRWTFPMGVFIPPNTADDVTGNAATFLNNGGVYVPNGTSGATDDDRRAQAIATLTPNGGLVTGVNASATQLTVVAELSPVTDTTPCGTVTTTAQIASVVNPLVLSHEEGFNSIGVTPSSVAASDLVVGTSELLKVTANLAGTTDTQDVTAQVDYEVIEEDRDLCVEFEDTTTQTRCSSTVLTFGSGGFLTTAPGTDGSFNVLLVDNLATPLVNEVTSPPFMDDTTIDEVEVRACFPLCADDSNDVLSPDTVFSNSLAIRAVPARLDPDSSLPPRVVIAPAPAPAPPQLAFTVPGVQFKAYGTYTAGALDANGDFQAAAGPDNQFSGGMPTADQNIGRYMAWVARPDVVGTSDLSEDFSDVAQLTNGSTFGSTEATGQVFYICNPAAPVDLDIIAVTNNTAVVSTAISDAIVPAKLNVQKNTAVTDRICE